MSSNYSPNNSWTEPFMPEKEFDVLCSQTLSKTVIVVTDNYDEVVERETDCDGRYVYEGYADTSNINWGMEYHDNGYHTPLQLLGLFKQCLEENKKHGIVFKSPRFTDNIIEECSNWTEDECEYIEN